MLVYTGRNTTVVRELLKLVDDEMHGVDWQRIVPFDADRYFFAHGLLVQRKVDRHGIEEIRNMVWGNLSSVAHNCDRILAENDNARICIMGSESGYSGSYNMLYAALKAGVHMYVENKAVKPTQQINAVAPWIIGDSGMTERRVDQDRLEELRESHPRKRFVTAREVAKMVHHLLYENEFISNRVIRM